MTQPDDTIFMKLAESVSVSSDDPNSQRTPESAVGAVIALGGKAISQSSNKIIGNINKNIIKNGDNKYFLIEHAERLAIFKAVKDNRNIRNSSIYSTRFPCSDCARVIVFFGIKRVVTRKVENIGKWAKSQEMANMIFECNGVDVSIVD